MPSKWIWPFELLEKLGEGGMGVVYRARYVGNNRIVAVKLLPEEVAQNPTLAARFDRELEILTQLKHPNIVHCFGGATESQQRFYAMELVEGGTLADALKKRKRLSWEHVVEYGLQICSALQYAHERGVIHRDLKPANFLLTKAGKLKLSDFGLATIAAGQRLTTAGRTAGTFLYMAPEQIRGKPPLSNRTDLYALGCVFFELLTGHPPFDGNSPAEILQKHLKEPAPRVASVILDCPQELDRLVSDLLQKDPERRPANAADVEQRLKSVLRPSLSHIDPFARTPSASVAQVVATPSDADLMEVETAAPPAPHLVRGLTAALLLTVIVAAWGWWSVYSLSRQVQQYRAAWVTVALEPGPSQIAALEQLTRLPGLSPKEAERLLDLIESDAETNVRVAALQVLSHHPRDGVNCLPRLISLQRTESDTVVRQELGTTRQALERAPRRSNGTGWLWIMGIIALLAAISYGLWLKLRRVAEQSGVHRSAPSS